MTNDLLRHMDGWYFHPSQKFTSTKLLLPAITQCPGGNPFLPQVGVGVRAT